MEVDRHVELLGALVDRPVCFQVEKFAVGHAVQHGALEAELGHRALKLVGGGFRIGGGQRREGGKAPGVSGAHLGQTVVDRAGEIGGDVGRKLLRRWRAMREHLDVDTGLVHFLDAQRAKIVKPLFGLVATASFQADEMLGQLPVPIMFFDGDDRAVRFFEHGAFPNS